MNHEPAKVLAGAAVVDITPPAGLAIRGALPDFPVPFIVSLTDGVPGYVPALEAYSHGGYEVEEPTAISASPAPSHEDRRKRWGARQSRPAAPSPPDSRVGRGDFGRDHQVTTVIFSLARVTAV